MGTSTQRLLGGIGRALITLGVLIVLFAGFQLWGTELSERRAQDALEDAFEAQRSSLLAAGDVGPATTAPTEPAPTPPTADANGGPEAPPSEAEPAQPVTAPALPAELLPEPGDTMGRIVIPAIGVDKYVVHGVRRADLRRGPGHFPETPMPGQAGNAAIAGHRTTYGAPFGDLDRLTPGDEILVETLQGTFRYEVMAHPGPDGTEVGHHIVDPYEGVVVLDDHGDDRLTLTACHPRYSAAQRIVVTARLTSPPAAPPSPPVEVATPATERGDPADEGDEPAPSSDQTGTASDDALEESMGWDSTHLPTTTAWAAMTGALALAVSALGRWWRRAPAWALGAPLVLVSLFVTFGHLDRMLPAL
jgi:sortase A